MTCKHVTFGECRKCRLELLAPDMRFNLLAEGWHAHLTTLTKLAVHLPELDSELQAQFAEFIEDVHAMDKTLNQIYVRGAVARPKSYNYPVGLTPWTERYLHDYLRHDDDGNPYLPDVFHYIQWKKDWDAQAPDIWGVRRIPPSRYEYSPLAKNHRCARCEELLPSDDDRKVVGHDLESCPIELWLRQTKAHKHPVFGTFSVVRDRLVGDLKAFFRSV